MFLFLLLLAKSFYFGNFICVTVIAIEALRELAQTAVVKFNLNITQKYKLETSCAH